MTGRDAAPRRDGSRRPGLHAVGALLIALSCAPPAAADAASAVTKTICPSGCDFQKLVPDARDWFDAQVLTGSGRITLQLADGVHEAADEFEVSDPKGGRLTIIGNCDAPSNTVLNFTNTADNRGGFVARRGGAIGLVDCLVINGVGARGPGEAEWKRDHLGTGIHAFGSGAWVKVGPRTTVRDFYYSLFADEGASIEGYGVRMENAGDCNLLARFNAHVRCLKCKAFSAGHRDTYRGASTVLGYNYMAEAGGSIRINESTGEGALVASVAAINNGAAWAHDYVGRTSRSGALVFEKGSLELDGAKLHDNVFGARGDTGGWLSLKYAEIYDNERDGVVANGSAAGVEWANIHDNGRGSGGHGIRVVNGGWVRGENTTLRDNASGATYVEATDQGCESSSGNCRPKSFLYLR